MMSSALEFEIVGQAHRVPSVISAGGAPALQRDNR
jgi:hypothetical protein